MQLLLLDEPFGALDPLVRRSLRDSLRQLVQRLGVTTVMVTHDQARGRGRGGRVRCAAALPSLMPTLLTHPFTRTRPPPHTRAQEEAWQIADHVVIFNRGRLEQAGAPADITRAPSSPFVMDFIGDTNHVPAGCQASIAAGGCGLGCGGGGGRVARGLWAARLPLPVSPTPTPTSLPPPPPPTRTHTRSSSGG